ncbi:VWA domain-containing protein, partial [uncultured Selenomonas sp.]|uniref:VWA domain-containing protein n=1 Tax=uncultured Selenomonas sp. TaxID=159275 RepID=UPI0025D9C95C
AEIYLVEAARAAAALAARTYVMPQDVEEAAVFVLAHRMSRKEESREASGRHGETAEKERQEPQDSQAELPPESPTDDAGQGEEAGDDMPHEAGASESGDTSEEDAEEAQGEEKPQRSEREETSAEEEADGEAAEGAARAMENVMARLSLLQEAARGHKGKSGRRAIVQLDVPMGRPWRTSLPRTGRRIDLAFAATLRAAAPYQRQRHGEQAVVIRAEDLRVWIRARRAAANILFLVDASGSMSARERMRMVKGAILSLLQEAYQKRDRVGLIAFRRDRAETLLPMTRSVELAEKQLRELPTGGRTPLAEGLAHALQMLHELEHRGGGKNVLVLVTDGRANTKEGDAGVRRALRAAEEVAGTQALSLVLDTERAVPRVGIAPELARRMDARYYTLEQLSAEGVLEIVRASRRR